MERVIIYSAFDIKKKYTKIFNSSDWAVKIINLKDYRYILNCINIKFYVSPYHFEQLETKFPTYLGVRKDIGNYITTSGHTEENWYGNNMPYTTPINIKEFKETILNKQLMGKIEEKLLEDFKKSNKERKEKLAKKFGFNSAEDYLKELETNLFGELPKVEEVKEEVLTDIVIAFDTTGSMSSYIQAVKNHVTDLIPKLFANTKNLQISIVAFGDYCDMKSSSNFGNAYQSIDLTSNSNQLIKFVSNAKNTGGGDEDEFYELVLQKIRLETSWRKGSNKSILLIADCNPHRVGYSCSSIVKNAQIDWKVEAQKLLSLNIKVDTLACTGAEWYKELSKITKGIYLLFSSSEKSSQLLEGYAYARSGATESFATATAYVTSTGDEELIGVYKQLGTL